MEVVEILDDDEDDEAMSSQAPVEELPIAPEAGGDDDDEDEDYDEDFAVPDGALVDMMVGFGISVDS